MRHAVAGMRDAHAVHAHPVDTDDKGLVLYGAGLQQLSPRVRARRRPVGDVHEHVVIELRAAAAEYGESQVVAHQRTDAQAAPLDRPGCVARGEVLILTAHPEEMALVVGAELTTGSRPQQAIEVLSALLR